MTNDITFNSLPDEIIFEIVDTAPIIYVGLSGLNTHYARVLRPRLEWAKTATYDIMMRNLPSKISIADGHHWTYYTSYRLRTHYVYKDGRRHGICRKYYDISGSLNLKIAAEYYMGFVRKFMIYEVAGNLVFESVRINGMNRIRFIKYDYMGAVIRESTYIDLEQYVEYYDTDINECSFIKTANVVKI
nr:Hypothetical protein FSTVLC9_449 [Faustovirus]